MAYKLTYEELEQRVKELERGVVERKRMEKSQETSGIKYRALAENSPDMIYILDSKDHFTYVAGAVETLLGFTAKELIGRHFTSIIWPDDAKKAECHFNERRTGDRSTKGFEVRLTTRRGAGKYVDIKYLPVELYAFGVYDKPVSAKDKKFLGTYGVARDITDRKQAEEALRISAEQWRTTFDTISDALCMMDMDGRIVRCNKALTDLLGKSFGEIVGRTCWEVMHGTSEPIEGCPMEHMRKTRRRERLVLEVDDRCLEITVDPLLDEAGCLAGAVHIITDITEHKRAEEALRESEERYRGVVEDTPVLICCFLPGSEITFVNKAYCEYFAKTPEELVGSNFLSLIPEDDRETVMAAISALTVDSPTQSHEHQVIAPGGDTRWQRWTNRALFDAQGKVVAYQSIGEDITKRKQAEEKVKEYSGQLEQMVDKRTKELRDAQEQLVRQEKLTTLGQLAGGLGHELRNPLGAIKNSVYLLNMVLEDPDPEVKETLGIIEKEVGISERVITSLLDFARPKAPARHVVNINDVVQEALSRIPVPENVEIVRQLSEILPTITADQDQLTQVFGNFILNAVQAMPEGGRLVVQSEVPNPESITISFTDTGLGIDEEALGKVLEPLFTTKSKGIGLGLALCKMFVEAHRGTIDVKSVVNKGTTFTVSLPISREEQE